MNHDTAPSPNVVSVQANLQVMPQPKLPCRTKSSAIITRIYAAFWLALDVVGDPALFVETHLTGGAHLAAHAFPCAQQAGFDGSK